MSKIVTKQPELEAYRLDKACTLSKKNVKSLTKGYVALFDCLTWIAS